MSSIWAKNKYPANVNVSAYRASTGVAKQLTGERDADEEERPTELEEEGGIRALLRRRKVCRRQCAERRDEPG